MLGLVVLGSFGLGLAQGSLAFVLHLAFVVQLYEM